MSDHLFFCYLSYMKGEIYRVTYNRLKGIAELHMENGDIKTVPMTDEEWKEMCTGDLCENFNKLLNEE